MATCNLCRLGAQSRIQNIGGDGSKRPDDLLVGDGLEANDVAQRRSFAGPVGQFLRQVVNRLIEKFEEKNGSRRKVRYTSATRCFPGNLSPYVGVDPCRGYLEREIRETHPKRIIALGGVAIQALSGVRLSVPNHVEGWFWRDGILVQMLDHPSGALRNNAYRPIWIKQFARAYLNPPPKEWLGPEDVEVKVVRSEKLALKILERAAKKKSVGFDSEFNTETARMLCYALAYDENKAYAFPHSIISLSRVHRALEDFLASPARKIAHNWKADAHALADYLDVDPALFTRVDVTPWSDTSGMRKIYNPEQDSALDLTEWQVGLGGHKSGFYASMRGKNGNAYERKYNADPDSVMRYCGLDALATWRAEKVYGRRLKADGLLPVWEESMGPIGPVLFDMECAGIPIDRDAQKILAQHTQQQMRLEIEAVRSSAPVKRLVKAGVIDSPDQFTPKSSPQMRALMFSKDGLNLKPIKETKGGKSGVKQASTDVDVRKYYEKKAPVLSHINEFSRIEKLHGTYVVGWDKLCDADSILHPNFRQDGARTGRLSAQRPNVMTLPRAVSEEAKMLRRMIVPFDPDTEALLEIDFSQAELRQLGQESGDKELVRCYTKRIDLHRRTAASMMGKEIDAVTPEERQRSKAINFGVIFGMAAPGLVSYAKKSYGVTMTLREAEHALKMFFSAYRGVRPHQAKVIAQARRTGYTWVNWVGTPFRRRPVPDICHPNRGKRGAAERVCRNTEIQGGAHEYMIRTLIATHTAWRKGEIPGLVAPINTVHDSVWLVVKRDAVDFVFRYVGCIATSWPTLHGIPIEVDAKAGDNPADWKEIGSINSLDEPKLPIPKKTVALGLRRKRGAKTEGKEKGKAEGGLRRKRKKVRI